MAPGVYVLFADKDLQVRRAFHWLVCGLVSGFRLSLFAV
jgi:hypothetical protein